MRLKLKFYYYGVDNNTGNKKLYTYCMYHAIKLMEEGVYIEHEIVDEDFEPPCSICDVDGRE